MESPTDRLALTGSVSCSGSCLATAIEPVCPNCYADGLVCRGLGIVCMSCHSEYRHQGKFADLTIGPHFPDHTTEEALKSEEASTRDTMLNYWIPLFQQLCSRAHGKAPKILSVGCGIGLDVDLLASHGFDSMGIDPGTRSRAWTVREHKNRLLLANGMKLPFREATFDAVFCGCVYPHVGVAGDSRMTTASCWQDRLALAREMVRVLKPGGRIFASGANRSFPVDIIHRRKPGAYMPRLNPPWSKFLLSVGDYRTLFETAGASHTRALGVRKYWGFVSSRKTLRGVLLSLAPRCVFWLTSNPLFAFLRGSIIDPWIVVTAEKTGPN